MGKYLDIVAKFEAEQQAQKTKTPDRGEPQLALQCSRCGKPVAVTDTGTSADGERTLLFWECVPCRTQGVSSGGTVTEKRDSPPPSRASYQHAAAAARADCFAIDPLWLIDQYPELWQQMVTLDEALLTLEQGGSPLAAYQEKLSGLVTLVQEIRRLQDKERETEMVQ